MPSPLNLGALACVVVLTAVLLQRSSAARIPPTCDLRRGTARALLVGLLVVGAWLRATDLGMNSFHDDELYHVAAALSYVEDGSYTLAWSTDCRRAGDVYTRAWPFTWQVAKSFELWGVHEAAARLPALAWGWVLLLLYYPLAKYFARSRAAALLAVAVMTFDPLFVYYSRFCRMYGMFVAVFLLAMLALQRAFERVAAPVTQPSTPAIARQVSWGWLALSLALYAVAAQLHELGHAFVLGALGHVGVLVLRRIRAQGSWRPSYALLAGACAIPVVAAVGLSLPHLVDFDRWFRRAPVEASLGFPPMILYGLESFHVGLLCFTLGIGVALRSEDGRLRFLLAFGAPILLAMSGSGVPALPRFVMFLAPLAWIVASAGFVSLGSNASVRMGPRWTLVTCGLLAALTFPRLSFPGLEPGVLLERAEADKPAAKGLYAEWGARYPACAPSVYTDTARAYAWIFEHSNERDTVLVSSLSPYYVPPGRSAHELHRRSSLRTDVLPRILAAARGIVALRAERDRYNLPDVVTFLVDRPELFPRVRALAGTGYDVFTWDFGSLTPEGRAQLERLQAALPEAPRPAPLRRSNSSSR